MSTKYNEEAEDLMFELFDEDDFTKVTTDGIFNPAFSNRQWVG